MATTLDEAISTAITTHNEEVKADAPKEEVKQEATPENKEEVKADAKEETTAKPELTLEQQQAIQLYEALKNPETAGQVVDFLATKAGYTKAQLKTATGKEEVKDEILGIFKEAMGEEFDFMTPKIASAVAKVIDLKVSQSTQDIRSKIEEREEEVLRNEGALATQALAQEYYGADEFPEDITNEVSKMMDLIQPSPGMSVKQYINICFKAVAGERGITKTTKQQQDKIKQNRGDVPSRLSTGPKVTPGENAKGDARMSLNDAVKDAIEKASK